ncbi:MAG: type II secretion system F family protein [Candidatus Diapherotrites archaeon]
MPELDDLRKQVEEKKKTAKKFGAIEKDEESIDLDAVDKIVTRMKKKYRDQGVEFEEVGGRLSELRGIIAESQLSKIRVQGIEDLTEFSSPTIRSLGRVYLLFELPLKFISKILRRMPGAGELGYYLYSANMKYSIQQYLAISTSVSVIAAFFVLLLFAGLGWFLDNNLILLLSPIIAIFVFLFAAIICFLNPKSKAMKRGKEISVELPFALRHMSTELKAGIGLYKTLQAIAVSDYGVLSEEFSRTISEVEEGTDTKVALRHFALRTESKSLRSALLHIIRALKTGGNLSDIMNKIAEDVSFELRIAMRDFGEKMNFFGVIFIFMAIVIPVFVAVIGGITNSPLPNVGGLGLNPTMMGIFYLVLMPGIMILLVYYLKIAQPTV